MRIHIDYFGLYDIKNQYDKLLRELEAYQKNSVFLKLDGVQSTPGNIAEACFVLEDGCYMRDYSEDEDGALKEVSFQKVTDVHE